MIIKKRDSVVSDLCPVYSYIGLWTKLFFTDFKIITLLTESGGLPSGKGKKQTDASVPLHELQPDYLTPYGKTTAEDIGEVLLRIHNYLDSSTPAGLVDSDTGEKIKDHKNPGVKAVLESGDFRLVSYEWGVTYAGMLHAWKATGDSCFYEYTNHRLQFIADLYAYYKPEIDANPAVTTPIDSVLEPKNLDDSGAMCTAMIKALEAGIKTDLKPLIDNFIDYINHKQYRFADGTLARNRPFPDTLWLDDLFMSVPALGRMGLLTGEERYFNDAVAQIFKFSERMFSKEKKIFMHGWVKDMDHHPGFFWARANGWAVMAMVELLEVLPADHSGSEKVLELFKEHMKGLASYQSGTGFWHQLIDRNDTFTETSSTAIITYSMARAINRGWVDKRIYGPVALLAWNAVATKVNDKGQVEGTCVGSGMPFDPAFYYFRPVNKYAAHGYGPTLLAGAEMISLLDNNSYEINDSTVQFP